MIGPGGRAGSARRFLPAIFLAAASFAGCARHPPPAVSPEAPPRSAASRLQQRINALLTGPALDRGSWGVVVSSLDRNETLKIVTLAAAAEELGWDFRYPTRVLVTGAQEGTRLNGDLVIVGSGDPTLDDWDGAASGVFHSWASLLTSRGIRTVSGRIVGDDNAFEEEGPGEGWAWDDLGSSFSATVGALQYNQNTARVMAEPGLAVGAPARLSIVPPVANLELTNAVTTVLASAPAAIHSEISCRGVCRAIAPQHCRKNRAPTAKARRR